MKLFSSPQAIISELAAMKIAETNRRDDRALVSEFFNGKPPLSDEQAAEIGLNINVNNLFGYTDLADAKAQLLGLYTKPTHVFTVEIDAMPANRLFERSMWEAEVDSAMNELIKDSGLFKPGYESSCGDAALHGEAVFAMPNTTHWCPRHMPLSKMLIPDDAPTDINRLTHWGFEGELSLRDLHRYASGDLPGWKTPAIRKILGKIYEKPDSYETEIWDAKNAEQWEEIRQRNPVNGNGRRMPSVRVDFFYQVRCDKPGGPVDLTILLSDTETIETPTAGDTDQETAKNKVLFEMECFFPSVREILAPVFMDCTLGGETKWHRVLGTGTLNYGLNQAIEILVNRIHQATYEGMMNLWQAPDASVREQVQEVLMRHNGVVPEGINLVRERLPVDIAGAMSMVQFFRQQGSKNSRKATENSGDQKLLEVQAMLANSQTEDVASSRTANWYEYEDRLGTLIASRLVNQTILPWQSGYSDTMKFQARLKRKGVLLQYLQPWNIRVRATRILGDGSSKREKEAALWLTQNRSMFPPQAQARITRISTAAMTGSYRLAEELVPIDPEPDTTQILRAETENNTAILQGRPMPVNETDVDDVHFPIHLEAMIGVVSKAGQDQQASFTPDDLRAFKALGAHAVGHVNKVKSMVGAGQQDSNKQKATTWFQALNQVVSVGEKMAHNLKQKQEGQNEKPDPVEVAKLQIAAQQLQLQMQKLDFTKQKFDRTQTHRETKDGSNDAFRKMMELERNRREDTTARATLATNDVNTALAVSQHTRDAAKPEPAKK
jgi:hypothetical protein